MAEILKVWKCTDHDFHYPVGVASIVVAATKQRATTLLKNKIKEHGLKWTGEETLEEIDLTVPAAHVLQDGNY